MKRGKPAPDAYIVATQQFQINNQEYRTPINMSNVLIFEDSITGLKGAIASGGKVVYVNSKKNDNDSEIVSKVDSLENLLPESFRFTTIQ